jgi:hypothetical protein
MKLSKNRLHKIKLKRNASRKKYNLRKKTGKKYENSRKKHVRSTDIKRKTMKIYIGGGDASSKPVVGNTTPIQEKMDPIQVIDNRLKKINSAIGTRTDTLTSFKKPMETIATRIEKTNTQLTKLKNGAQPNDKKEETRLTNMLKIDKNLNKTNIQLAANLEAEIQKLEAEKQRLEAEKQRLEAEKQKEKQKKKEEDMVNEIKAMCNNIKLDENDTETSKQDINNIANEVKNTYLPESIFTAQNLEIKIENTYYFHVETTSEGECMYSSFIFGMFYNGIGDWFGKGWVPEKKESGGKINYMGNLRLVLANYICVNLDTIIKAENVSIIHLLKAMKRITTNQWGEDTEILLLARMFGVCVGIFKKVGNNTDPNTFELYDSSGVIIQNDATDIPDNRTEQIMQYCYKSSKENIIYLLELRQDITHLGYHFQSLITNTTGVLKDDSSTLPPSVIAGSLNQYECEPDKIDTNVPDNINEAQTKYESIHKSLMSCPDDIDNMMKIRDKLTEYISNFEKNFGKGPIIDYIDDMCKYLFEGDMNYEIVPDDKDLADEKMRQYVELLEKHKNDSQCSSSVDTAFGIYKKNYEKKFPGSSDTNSTNADANENANANANANANNSNECPSEKINVANLFNPENLANTCNISKKKWALSLHPDRNIDCKEEAEAKFNDFNTTYEQKCASKTDPNAEKDRCIDNLKQYDNNLTNIDCSTATNNIFTNDFLNPNKYPYCRTEAEEYLNNYKNTYNQQCGVRAIEFANKANVLHSKISKLETKIENLENEIFNESDENKKKEVQADLARKKKELHNMKEYAYDRAINIASQIRGISDDDTIDEIIRLYNNIAKSKRDKDNAKQALDDAINNNNNKKNKENKEIIEGLNKQYETANNEYNLSLKNRDEYLKQLKDKVDSVPKTSNGTGTGTGTGSVGTGITSGTGTGTGTGTVGTGTGTVGTGSGTGSVGTGSVGTGSVGTGTGTGITSGTGTGTGTGTGPPKPPKPNNAGQPAGPGTGAIELVINEKEFNTKLKRVNIDIVIPRDAQVIVRDYAKNTVRETLNAISSVGI